MKEIIEGIKVLATKELISANNKFPMFQSTHEGYAVLLEEVEEVIIELQRIKYKMARLWDKVKSNDVDIQLLESIKETSEMMAAESIQCAAMCTKFIESGVANEKTR